MSPRAEAAETAAAYLLERTIERAGPRAFQGARTPPIRCRAPWPDTVRRFATERIHRVPTLAAQALVAWAEGNPVELITYVPDARHVHDLQARGARCVSVLPECADTTPHAHRLEFLLHDLCHLGKFMCTEHYAEQVGFFAALRAAFEEPAWRRLEAALDDDFRRDLDHVASDMNGSSVFLFAVLKMKLKMAARRRCACDRGVAPPSEGPLSPAESEVFHELFELALDALGFDGFLRTAACHTSARRDAPDMAAFLADYFTRRGSVILSGHSAYD